MLVNILESEVCAFAKILFPVSTISDPYELLFKNISTFYNIRIINNATFD